MKQQNSLSIGIDINEANVVNRVGSNQYAFEILKSIEKSDNNTNFTLYSSLPKIDDLPKGRSKWHYRHLSSPLFWTQWRLPLDLYLHQPKPDIFFNPGHYAPRFSPIPTVIAIMDLAFLLFPQFFRKKDAAQLTSWTKYSVKKAEHIITISQNTKRDIIKHYQVPENKVTVAYPGFHKTKFKPTSEKSQLKVREKYNLSNKYILYLGTLQPRKNLVRLIEAFEEVSHTHPNLILAISGKKGWLYEDLVKKINNSPRKSHIRLTGFVHDEDIPALYTAAECFVLPGLYEGFGIPPLESIACGTIPVVSDTAALPEVIGSSGILVDPYDVSSISQGIQKAIKLTPDQKNNLLKASSKNINKFDWTKSANIVLEVLYEVALQK